MKKILKNCNCILFFYVVASLWPDNTRALENASHVAPLDKEEKIFITSLLGFNSASFEKISGTKYIRGTSVLNGQIDFEMNPYRSNKICRRNTLVFLFEGDLHSQTKNKFYEDVKVVNKFSIGSELKKDCRSATNDFFEIEKNIDVETAVQLVGKYNEVKKCVSKENKRANCGIAKAMVISPKQPLLEITDLIKDSVVLSATSDSNTDWNTLRLGFGNRNSNLSATFQENTATAEIRIVFFRSN